MKNLSSGTPEYRIKKGLTRASQQKGELEYKEKELMNGISKTGLVKLRNT